MSRHPGVWRFKALLLCVCLVLHVLCSAGNGESVQGKAVSEETGGEAAEVERIGGNGDDSLRSTAPTVPQDEVPSEGTTGVFDGEKHAKTEQSMKEPHGSPQQPVARTAAELHTPESHKDHDGVSGAEHSNQQKPHAASSSDSPASPERLDEERKQRLKQQLEQQRQQKERKEEEERRQQAEKLREQKRKEEESRVAAEIAKKKAADELAARKAVEDRAAKAAAEQDKAARQAADAETARKVSEAQAAEKAEEQEARRQEDTQQTERKTSEAESARRAAEAEAARKAAEGEAARKAAEAEAARKAAEQKAARKAAAEQAEKQAAEQEAARKATEAEARRRAEQAEAARQAAAAEKARKAAEAEVSRRAAEEARQLEEDRIAKEKTAEAKAQEDSQAQEKQDRASSDSVQAENPERQNRKYVIDNVESEASDKGALVGYRSPGPNGLDKLIGVAGKVLKALASGAMDLKEVAEVAIGKIGSAALVRRARLWASNSTAHSQRFEAAQSALLSVAEGTAVALRHTPDFLERSSVVLDEFAQKSLEKALEVAEVGVETAQSVKEAAVEVAGVTLYHYSKFMASPRTQQFKAWAKRRTTATVQAIGRGSKVVMNQILWTFAFHSDWLRPASQVEYPGAMAVVYNDTNNIHAIVPVFTKAHEYLGTFRDESGPRLCSEACWGMTVRAMKECGGFEALGGTLLDPASRASCPVCRSFVWYSSQHDNVKLTGKCFAVTSGTWAPAYEANVISGVFRGANNHPSGDEHHAAYPALLGKESENAEPGQAEARPESEQSADSDTCTGTAEQCSEHPSQ